MQSLEKKPIKRKPHHDYVPAGFFNNFSAVVLSKFFKIEILHLDSVPGFFIISSYPQIFFEKTTFNELFSTLWYSITYPTFLLWDT